MPLSRISHFWKIHKSAVSLNLNSENSMNYSLIRSGNKSVMCIALLLSTLKKSEKYNLTFTLEEFTVWEAIPVWSRMFSSNKRQISQGSIQKNWQVSDKIGNSSPLSRTVKSLLSSTWCLNLSLRPILDLCK